MVIKRRQQKARGQQVRINAKRQGIGFRAGGGVGLSCYAATFTEELTLPQFEKYAADRLAVLRLIHTETGLGKDVLQNEALRMKLRDTGLDRDVQKDNISHFILRLGFCNNEDNRKWFRDQEVSLFKFRYDASQNQEEKQALLDELMGAEFEVVTMKDLYQAGPGVNGHSPLPKVTQNGNDFMVGMDRWGKSCKVQFPFYKVPILDTAVHYMVGKRKVFVKGGYAYVPAHQFKNIVFGRYRTRLSKELLECRSKLHELREEDRIYGIVANLHKAAVGEKYKPNGQAGSVKPKDVAMLAARGSFPLCMRGTYDHLKKDSHLKHHGRMHFGLFLKGIGLGMEDALKFWSKMFAKKTSGEKFAKNYAYNIRHNYGKEGNRKDNGKGYSAYSCDKIITGQYASDDHSGCPFKLMDEENLQRRLRGIGLNQNQALEISKKAKDKHYNIACRMVFKLTHSAAIRKLHNREWEEDIESEASWNHPNSYFDLSRKCHDGFDVPTQATGGGGMSMGSASGIPSFPSVTQMQGGMHPTQNIIQPMAANNGAGAMDVSS